MASMRLNSPAYTPRGGSLGRNGGYGFSYSTYGTPGSAFSGSLTPGASSMLRPSSSFGSTLGSRLNKSISMGNLRGDGTPGEGRSLLRESALSPPGSAVGRYGDGSVRKLNIDRSLRTDLFGTRNTESEQSGKRVNFNGTAETPEEIPREPQPSRENALVRTETDDTPEREEPPALMKAPPQPSGPSRQPEMSQINGTNGALSTVPEDGVPQRPGSAPATQSKGAPKSGFQKEVVGEYWTQPALRDLKNMSRQQLQKVGKFVVGRHGVGRIEFGPCDLSNTPLDDICGEIVRLNPRSATVYQDDVNKPAMGKALNVPSTIYLENSWPRSHGGRKAVHATEGREYDKHIARLKRVSGTKFVSYDAKTGVWQFTVEHFTTYGLDDDDEDDEEFTEQAESSGLSDAPETPEQQGQEDVTMQNMETSFRSSDPVQAPSPGAIERYHSSLIEDDAERDQPDDIRESAQQTMAASGMPGAFAPEPKLLRSILKPSTNAFASPDRLATETWEEQLQRTISPRKRDRAALRQMQQSLMRALDDQPAGGMESPLKQSLLGRSTFGESYLAQKSAKKAKFGPTVVEEEDLGKSQAFKTSMDIMKSLWAEDKSARKGKRGFEYPYSKKPRLSTTNDQDKDDAAFHDSFKPSFAGDGTLVYSAAGSAPAVSGELQPSKQPVVGEHQDVRFARFAPSAELVDRAAKAIIETQMEYTIVEGKDGRMPMARTSEDITFAIMAKAAPVGKSLPEQQERAIWQLSSVLFDPLEVACADFINDVPKEQAEAFAERMRRDAFVTLWSQLVAPTVEQQLRRAKSAEEKALLLLTKNDIAGACEALVGARDFRLASLIAQLPGSKMMRETMRTQIEAWQRRKDWSEMSDAIRTLYSVLAGSVCTVTGQAGAAEDRASEFCISEKFGLDWKQSLALQVLHGGHGRLVGAINAYEQDVEKGRQSVKPSSAWAPERHDRNSTEDTLMLLCRLFAHGSAATGLDALCEPTAVSGSALSSRVAWQLGSLLAKKVGPMQEDKSAQLAIDFASQLESARKVPEAAWVLLHLHKDPDRIRAVTALMQRNAGQITDPDLANQDGNFEIMTQKWSIPRSIVLAAKALHAKAASDSWLQIRYLLNGGHIAEAHQVLCDDVAPTAVIEQDFADLVVLMGKFPPQKPVGWKSGGLVYDAFTRLMNMDW
ncbi:hypothetical protein BAUCODRAFT_403519 [Baudoinia panamericana UAMH 10762]|uniref:Peptidase S59 domain-containing protein n=1 Tax=Baudoinia panamericana (strain UAMH 10762) TaxID=717646 RepID=M2NFJ5_BAUPA|nr:uncharacterized protein BAUCODRAFT_403519 [Baudoinia panamericana UAMH 10762]EMC97775.1 hypothetical protein BAUCODRAFT_403519 [Baudoinia panamericana UAMH 10762]